MISDYGKAGAHRGGFGKIIQEPSSSSQIGLLLVSLCALLSLTGCITTPNGKQFYQDNAGAAITNLPPYSGSTRIITPSNPTNDMKELYRSGYGLLGEAAFQGPPQSNGALISQAKKVGADVVLYTCVYLGSEEATVPLIQYQPGQTYTTTSSGVVNGNAWGSGGYAYGTGHYNGTSTTTTPGTFSTQYVPITVRRYAHDAGFFRKVKPPIFGVLPEVMPDVIRRQLERNTGVYVWVLRTGSPAFNANILEGDVILKFNGEDVVSIPNFVEKYKNLAGQKVELEIWRNGQFKTISVQLNNKP